MIVIHTGEIYLSLWLAKGIFEQWNFCEHIVSFINYNSFSFLFQDIQKVNWFSGASALKVYGQYLNLDKNHNGMLSKEELAG